MYVHLTFKQCLLIHAKGVVLSSSSRYILSTAFLNKIINFYILIT